MASKATKRIKLFIFNNCRIFSAPNKRTTVKSIVRTLRAVKLSPKIEVHKTPTNPCKINEESINEFLIKSPWLKFWTCVIKSQSSFTANSPNGYMSTTTTKYKRIAMTRGCFINDLRRCTCERYQILLANNDVVLKRNVIIQTCKFSLPQVQL